MSGAEFFFRVFFVSEEIIGILLEPVKVQIVEKYEGLFGLIS